MGRQLKPELLFHEAAEVFAVETRAPAGWLLGQHAHEHDHLSFLASGTCELTVDGAAELIEGPAMLTLKAGKAHAVRALTPIVWLCLWGSGFGMQAEARESLKLLEGA